MRRCPRRRPQDPRDPEPCGGDEQAPSASGSGTTAGETWELEALSRGHGGDAWGWALRKPIQQIPLSQLLRRR